MDLSEEFVPLCNWLMALASEALSQEPLVGLLH